ncbi:hypothetical protein GTS_45490 [Gandjariella thermophila]|uniref:Uncharacterized protein n=1 Tax=Gandjariella thermophila TaxID=1931992 RepID=A0A4D4JEW7_9PSEU|nr:hypothetical protein GTS_45490 [Gandjariella thermophila]
MVVVGLPHSLAGGGEQVSQLFGVEFEPFAGWRLHADPSVTEGKNPDAPCAAHDVCAVHLAAWGCAVRVLPS